MSNAQKPARGAARRAPQDMQVAILGRPNVGKSTLFNRLVGARLAAVSHKPQATRHSIFGARGAARGETRSPKDGLKSGTGRAHESQSRAQTGGPPGAPPSARAASEPPPDLPAGTPPKTRRDSPSGPPPNLPTGTPSHARQDSPSGLPPDLVFIDTPGLGDGATLGRTLRRNAQQALDACDLSLLVSEFGRWQALDDAVLDMIRAAGKPCIAVLNKVDRAPLLAGAPSPEALREMAARHAFAAIVPLSARRDAAFDGLERELRALLPRARSAAAGATAGAVAGDECDDKFLVAERIREQIMRNLHRELPYVTHVAIDTFQERPSGVHVRASILVERESQRGIVLGKGGRVVKRISESARRGAAALLGKPVHLFLRVALRPDWRRDPRVVGSYLAPARVAGARPERA